MSIFSDLSEANQQKVREGLSKYGAIGVMAVENDADTLYSILRGKIPLRFGGKPPVVHHEPVPEYEKDILL